MKKITERIVGAFIEHRSASSGNARTDGESLYLHGNRIAWYDDNGKLWDGRPIRVSSYM